MQEDTIKQAKSKLKSVYFTWDSIDKLTFGSMLEAYLAFGDI